MIVALTEQDLGHLTTRITGTADQRELIWETNAVAEAKDVETPKGECHPVHRLSTRTLRVFGRADYRFLSVQQIA